MYGLKKIITAGLGVALLSPLLSFTVPPTTELKVEVTRLRAESTGQLWVSVFVETGFLEKSVQTKSVEVNGKSAQVVFTLPPGTYAVSTYQDVNGNKKLDRYLVGKPKEPYGFSNNVKPFGAPAFKDCSFELSNVSKSISIQLID